MSDDASDAGNDRLTAAEAQLGVALPEPLRPFYSDGDGHFRSDGGWWVVWPLDRVVRDNIGAWNGDRLPRTLLAFGDDGTGNPFCMALDEKRDEVLRWSWIDRDVETSQGPIHDFVREWVQPE